MSANRWREWAGPALLVLAVAVVAYLTMGGQSGSSDDASAGSSLSPAPLGTLALYQWLAAGGYSVARVEQLSAFRATLDQADVFWALAPATAYSNAEAEQVLDWLSTGGTLVLAVEGGRLGANDRLQTRLGISLNPLIPAVDGRLPLAQPVFAHPPVAGAQVNTGWTLHLTSPDVVPLVQAGPDPVLATWRYGHGRVFVLAGLFPFTNAGLDPASNGPLAWNLAAQGRGRRQLFDEVHHGFTGTDLRTALLSQPWGWALVYVLAAVVLYLVASGRRLGPPLPAAADGPRRGTMDYVRSLAGLFHRAGRSEWAAARAAADFRRALAAPTGLDPAAPAPLLAAAVTAIYPTVDAAAIQRVLERLDAAAQTRLSDGALLRLVQEADAIRARLEG